VSCEREPSSAASDYVPTAEGQRRQVDVHERLVAIDAAGAPGRAAALLHNLGFPEAGLIPSPGPPWRDL
jgi:ATP-binding cassette subfamily F protein 3